MSAAIDTNVLAYAEGLNGAPMEKQAQDLLENIRPGSAIIPVQVLGELFHLLVRKGGRSPLQARSAILGWRNTHPSIDTSATVLLAAADLATRQFSFWDAVILSAAAEANCQLLLSEDMQNGFVWRGVTVINPFARPFHPLLDALLTS